MASKLTNKCICLLSIIVISAVLFSAALPAHAAAIPITVIDADGVSHPIADITTLTATTGAGGYKTPSGSPNVGTFQGVSLLTLCNSIGTNLESYQNVTVQTSGGSGTTITFNYDQVANGISIAPQYGVYDVNGNLQAPTQPVTLIVAYQQANGTALPGSGTTRLLIVGPEGLLFQGQGLAGVSTITITNVGPVPTPTPTPSPTPIPTTSPSPTPTHSATPSPSPSPTAQPTASPTPTNSPSPTPAGTSSSEWPVTYTVIIAAIIIIVIIAIVAVVFRRR